VLAAAKIFREAGVAAPAWLCWLRQSSARAAPNNSRPGCAPVAAARSAARAVDTAKRIRVNL